MSLTSKFSDMKVSDYSDKSIAVQGDTRKYKEDLKKLGGKYNFELKGGPGWVFPKTREKEINDFISGGKRLVSEEEAKAGEERTRERKKEFLSERSSSPTRENSYQPRSFLSQATPTLGEFAILLNTINNISTKINKIEIAVNFLLSDEQKKTLNAMTNASTSSTAVKGKVVNKVVKKVVKKKESESESESFSSDEEIPVRRLLR